MTGAASDSFRLTGQALDVGEAWDLLRDERAGAADLFIGTTRRYTDDRETEHLSYEAYEAMVIPEIRRMVERARDQWDILRCVVHHRTGTVRVGEASVIVGVSTRHRAEAFAACRFLIDALKEGVPIWKQETWVDGSTGWVEGAGGSGS